MGIPIVQADAFTAEPFHGNPAAVCVLSDERPEAWMQAVAAEMNLAETVFLTQREPRVYGIRWFTPTVEVPLCGHATLASAHVLWERDDVPAEQRVRFQSKSGVLAADRADGWIRLDFPALPLTAATLPAELAEGFGLPAAPAWRNAHGTFLVELAEPAQVAALSPNFARLRRSSAAQCIVTARSDDPAFDFVSRFFAPSHGIDEDPVTGSAHCSLAPYWTERLGRNALTGHQISQRGGVVKVRTLGDRVDLLGQAVTVLRGELIDAGG